GLLARLRGLDHRPVLDGPERPAGHAVEHVDETLLGDLGHGAHAATLDCEVDQIRSCRNVVIPEPVAYQLEVPHAPAGRRLEADEAVREQFVARPTAAIVVVRGRAEGQIDVAELLVGAHDRPHVHPADGAPRLAGPGLVAELARPRNRVEDPALRARADLHDPAVAGRAAGTH